jgi:four helix bundle protein
MRDEGKSNRQSARPHEKLEVYRIAHALSLKIHSLTLHLPKHELYEDCSQVRRSSKSVSAQIVEGHALRQYKPEYLHYLARAYGSSEETIEHIKFLVESGSGKIIEDQCKSLLNEYAVLSRKLFNYMESVRKEHNPTRPIIDER